MKKVLFTILVLLTAVTTSHAAFTYTYGPGTNFGSMPLNQNESMLVNGGGGGSLDLFYNSYVRIESTPPLGTDYGGGVWAGGIWEIKTFSSSTLEVLGGEIGVLITNNTASASLYGGKIVTIESHQQAPTGSDKHIDLFCKSHSYNSGNGMLTGVWGDDSAFSIHLVNVGGYTPAIDNINFVTIPEPLTLVLLGLGGLVVRRYVRQ
jgi:hypothetical protein